MIASVLSSRSVLNLLPAAPAEDLDAVVLVRVVGGGDDDTEVVALPARARALAREVRDGGGRNDPRRFRVGALRGQARGEVLLDGGSALTRVAADEHARLGDAEGAHDRAPDGLHRRRIQRRL